MPKVKAKRGGKSRKKQQDDFGFWQSVTERFSNLGVAMIAGMSVVLAIVAVVLFSGGYVGLAAERAGAMMQRAAVGVGLDIRRVTAVGYDKATDGDIRTAVGPVIGASIAHFDIHAARARIESLGWVRSASVTRLWPNTIHVSVRERTPAAVWQLAGDTYLIDQTGAVIQQIGVYEYSNLPLIVGAGAPESVSDVLRALRNEPELWGKAAALVRVGERRWNMRLKDDGDVRFPEHDVESAVKTLARLQAAYGLLDRPLEYVDLRDPSRLVYRERAESGAVTQEQQIR